jgi:hypothetical protein
MLFTKQWPKTIYPSLPWTSVTSISSKIPMALEADLVGLNYDSKIIDTPSESTSSVSHSDYWVVDFPNTQWSRSISKTLRYQISPVRKSRWESSEDALVRLQNSVGCLISVHGHGVPWWSSTLSQALRYRIPVVTDWSLSSMLGPEWSMLAQSVEDMSDDERDVMVEGQRTSYLKAVPSWKSSVKLTCNALLKE